MELLPQAGNWMACKLDLGVVDDDGEPIVMFYRDPIECIQKLFSKPEFKGKMVYAPQKEFRADNEEDRVYSEMWTSNWWWEIQVSEYLCVMIDCTYQSHTASITCWGDRHSGHTSIG